MAINRLKQTFSQLSPKLEVRDTKNYGKGVYAKKNIRKDEIITIFGGYIISRAEEGRLPKNLRDVGMQISDEFIIGIRKKQELEAADYYNHSCDPNAGFRGQIFLVAMRNIRKGEEVMFDYGMVLHRAKGAKPYILQCECKSKNCRKVVTEHDWKAKDLQKRYDGYFQYFLQEKINKFKNK